MSDGKVEEFLGIRVEQDSYDNGYNELVEQWDQEELEAFLRPLLDGGVSLHWTQYTPYFMDGEPCIFDVNEFAIKFDGLPDDVGAAYRTEGFVDVGSVYVIGGEETRYQRLTADTKQYGWGPSATYGHVPTGRTFPKHPLADEIAELADKWAHFEQLFLKTFGDHVEVTVTPEKIVVASYEHD